MAKASTISLSPDEAEELRRICNASTSAQAKVFRARIILRCASPDDPTNWQIAIEFVCDPDTVSKWRRRFAKHRLDGLEDLPRSGAPRTFSP
jgi:hypothetical protein